MRGTLTEPQVVLTLRNGKLSRSKTLYAIDSKTAFETARKSIRSLGSVWPPRMVSRTLPNLTDHPLSVYIQVQTRFQRHVIESYNMTVYNVDIEALLDFLLLHCQYHV